MNPYLTTDYRKLGELLEDSLVRLECLKECHLEEHQYLPDFVFPLEKALVEALEQTQLELAQARVRWLSQVEEKVEVLEPWAPESE